MKYMKLSALCVFLLLFGYFIHGIIYGAVYPSSYYPWSEYLAPPKMIAYASYFINLIIFVIIIPILSYRGLDILSHFYPFLQNWFARISIMIGYTSSLFLLFNFLFNILIVGCD